jgi:hypothetical protein
MGGSCQAASSGGGGSHGLGGNLMIGNLSLLPAELEWRGRGRWQGFRRRCEWQFDGRKLDRRQFDGMGFGADR